MPRVNNMNSASLRSLPMPSSSTVATATAASCRSDPTAQHTYCFLTHY